MKLKISSILTLVITTYFNTCSLTLNLADCTAYCNVHMKVVQQN